MLTVANVCPFLEGEQDNLSLILSLLAYSRNYQKLCCPILRTEDSFLYQTQWAKCFKSVHLKTRRREDRKKWVRIAARSNWKGNHKQALFSPGQPALKQ